MAPGTWGEQVKYFFTLRGKGRTQLWSKQNKTKFQQCKTQCQMAVTYDPLVSKGPGLLHLSGSAANNTGACLIGSGQLHSTSAAVFSGHPWYLYYQYAAVSPAIEAAYSLMASPDLSSGILTLPHGVKPQFLSRSSKPEICSVAEVGPSQIASFCFSQCQASAAPHEWPLNIFKVSTTWETQTYHQIWLLS